MSRMIKKISLWMAVIVVLGLLPAAAAADSIFGSLFGSGFGSAFGDFAKEADYTMTVGETITVSTKNSGSAWEVTEGSGLISLSDKKNYNVQVTALQPGTAKITHTYGTKTETFIIKVEDIINVEEKPKELYFTSSHKGRKVHRGEMITLTAHVSGYEAYDYEIVWQYSVDGGANYTDIGTGETFTFKETRENIEWTWRFVLVQK